MPSNKTTSRRKKGGAPPSNSRSQTVNDERELSPIPSRSQTASPSPYPGVYLGVHDIRVASANMSVKPSATIKADKNRLLGQRPYKVGLATIHSQKPPTETPLKPSRFATLFQKPLKTSAVPNTNHPLHNQMLSDLHRQPPDTSIMGKSKVPVPRTGGKKKKSKAKPKNGGKKQSKSVKK